MHTPSYIHKMRLRTAAKKLGTIIFGPYRVNRIYRLSSEPATLDLPPGIAIGAVDDIQPMASPSSIFRPRSSYGGDDSQGFGLVKNGELACLCWFWGARRFNDPHLWTLNEGEAILVDLLTAPEFRGQGLAPILINHASNQMLQRGYAPLYTWMWHTHRASSRSFEKAGWEPFALVAEFYPLNLGRAVRLQRSLGFRKRTGH